MKDILFYLIFAIILYLVLSRVFEKFNLEQENFDPSLVPVSSIVTLAKVAQKLVNGNGILTNPGSLQIGGSATAPGNLNVTGVTNIGGSKATLTNPTLNVNGSINLNDSILIKPPNNKPTLATWTINAPSSAAADYAPFIIQSSQAPIPSIVIGPGGGNLNIYSTMSSLQNLTVGGTLGVKGATTLEGTLSVTGATTVGGTLGVTGNTTVGGTLGVTGLTNIDGILTVNNTTQLGGINYNTRIGKIWSQPGIYAEGTTNDLEIGAGSSNVYIGPKGNGFNNLIVTGDTRIGKTLNVDGDLSVTGKITTPVNINNTLNVTGLTQLINTTTTTDYNGGAYNNINDLTAQVDRLEKLVGAIIGRSDWSVPQTDTINDRYITVINQKVKSGEIKNYYECINAIPQATQVFGTDWNVITNLYMPHRLRGIICSSANYFTEGGATVDTRDKRKPQWK